MKKWMHAVVLVVVVFIVGNVIQPKIEAAIAQTSFCDVFQLCPALPTPQDAVATTTQPEIAQHATTSTIGVRTKTANCVIVNAMPDAACTPGAVFADVTADQVCVSGYAGSVRDVPQSEKNAVYAEYGIATHTAGEYEVDHLISLELGGSNDIANLWPESAEPRPGFHEKDKVENYLHAQVCAGKISLEEAQREIAGDWERVYEGIRTTAN